MLQVIGNSSEGPAVLAARELYAHFRQHSVHQSKRNHGLLCGEAEFNIYPNPSLGDLTVEYSISKDSRMLVYDMLSRKVFSIDLKATVNQVQFSLQELAPGLYTYFVRTEENVVHQGKIILQ